MTFQADLKTLLLSAGLTNIVNGSLPHTPDEVVMTKIGTGLDANETHDGMVYDRPRALILIRAATSATAWVNVALAFAALRKRNFSVNGNRYLSVVPLDSPTELGKDGQKPARHEVSFNVQAVKG